MPEPEYFTTLDLLACQKRLEYFTTMNSYTCQKPPEYFNTNVANNENTLELCCYLLVPKIPIVQFSIQLRVKMGIFITRSFYFQNSALQTLAL